MSEIENGNLDGELLSAYLDDELAPEERAHVEARLAADPAARRLLDELRSVSQAVRDLPKEAHPGDLAATVLRRAERAMLTTEALTSSAASSITTGRFSELASKMPIGRSRRSWFWAGLTIAAGLMIMFFEKRKDRNHDLPGEVASRRASVEADHEVAEVRHPMLGLELRAVGDETSAPATATSSGKVAVGAPVEFGREELAKEAPAATSTITADAVPGTLPPQAPKPNDMALRGEPVSAPAPALQSFGSGGGVAGAVVNNVPETPPEQGFASEVAPEAEDVDLLVVHVNAKQEAIEGKLIDGVLLRNGIAVEDEVLDFGELAAMSSESPPSDGRGDQLANSSTPSAAATRSAESPQRFSAQSDMAKKLAEPPVDVVLVEAEPSQIVSCLSDLDADRTNYLGIAVDDELTRPRRSGGAAQYKWKEHNRGNVSGQQKVQVDANQNFYFESNGRQFALGRDAESTERDAKQKSEQLADRADLRDSQSQKARGRALRMQNWGVPQTAQGAVASDGISGYGAQRQAAAEPYDQYSFRGSNLLSRSVDKLAAKANTLQVLFVLTCPTETEAPAEAPASSPPPADAVP